MNVKIQELESRRVRALMELLLKAARHVPPDKAPWKPEEGAKSAQEIVEHVTGVNEFFAQLIRGAELSGGPVPSSYESYEQALSALQASGEAVAEAIQAVPDEQLEAERTLPWGEAWKLRKLLVAPGTHIAYHWGQISYLQTLWGDFKDYHLIP
jgi:uncharacterized damage-inducible protein DinB